MSKTKTTMKAIKNNWRKVYRCGYCDLQDIMKYSEPNYYTCGVYGWNCDIYCDYGKDIAITTGYRGMAGERVPSDVLEKYTNNAKKILEDTFKKTYDEISKALEENREAFFNELN